MTGERPRADEPLRRRRVYSGRVISVDVDLVQFPDGSSGELEVVRHPGASAVVPLLTPAGYPEPEILLLRQYRYAASGYLYEVPAGRLEADEDPRACAERELLEETGFRAGRLEPLMTLYTTPGFTDERIHLFLASDLSRGAAAPERDEFIELVPRSLAAAVAMIERGEIVDAKTALAVLFTASFRRRPEQR